ncbi:MAG: cytochrome c oxidase subunit II [Natronomonas sp.]|jgi:cytochrome c oxidase subunit 2|uniref:Cytochrome c oxidase subunit II n=1 Tax=Natronomonas salsuginis TaxID=2217661 RepID=A0A4U5J8F1_9EURY|nr:cytochrome c oxidase subunit II [Natronomonas salsuginis]MDR9380878.1 cytochrome c oxidase subunit II [Natronomonas sp.]TKR25370.1 cytochrome c oxidase subunit II [Natronomonas salsuginis]
MIDPFVLQQVPENWRAQAEVFSEIFLVFLAIGTVVGVVVVAYTLYNAYKYRGSESDGSSFDAPQLGELPTGQSGGKSKKLFLSFALSAIVVISVVVYSYTLLLYVEAGPTSEVETEGSMEIDVVGFQFGWEFEYPNGQTSLNEMRVPAGEDQVIRLHVTSDDVWHAFGITELRVKADAIPGETATTWFVADEPGTYAIECFELCGIGHSQMGGQVTVMEPDEFNEWYEGTDEGTSQSQVEVSS